MGSETLQWRLRLRDEASQASGRAARGVREYQRALGSLRAQESGQRAANAVWGREQRNRAREALARIRDRQRAETGAWRSQMRALAAVGGGAVSAALAVAGIGAAFAGVGAAAASSVVEIAAFRESSLTALQAVLGSSQAAGRTFRNAIQIANQTPLDTRDVIAATQSFAVAGFQEREIQPLLAASADLGAAFGQRSSEGFAFALSQIRAAGQLQGQELLQLQNANVSREAVLASIARQLGLGTGEAGNRAALNAIRQRRVSSAVGIQAALDAVRSRLDGGRALGSFARDQSETLTGALSNARNALFNLIVGMDLGNLPGIRALKDTILRITAALQDGSPAAMMIRQGISSAANALGGFLANATSTQNIAATFATVQSAVRGIGGFLREAWPIARDFFEAIGPGFAVGIAPLRGLLGTLTGQGPATAGTLATLGVLARALGAGIGFVVGGLGTLAGAAVAPLVELAALWQQLTGLGNTIGPTLRAAFTGVGTQIVEGIRAGISGAVTGLTETVSGLGTSAVNAARAALGIQSPSRVFADVVGRQIPAGIQLGIERGSGPLDASVAGLAQPGALAMGGARANVSIVINVQRGGGDEATARTIADVVEERLADIFGSLAEQTA